MNALQKAQAIVKVRIELKKLPIEYVIIIQRECKRLLEGKKDKSAINYTNK